MSWHTKMEIDILYPIRADLNDEKFFKRFQCSIDSLKKNNYDGKINFCFSDCSPKPLKEILQSMVGGDIKYIHFDNKYPTFNKAWTINVGVKNIIETSIFKISDVDIVYCSEHMNKVMAKMDNGNGLSFLSYTGHKMLKEIYSSDFNKLRIVPGEWMSTPGIPTLVKKDFYELRGYDEKYLYRGKEDSDFEYRIRHSGRCLEITSKTITVIHLWHEANNWNDPARFRLNRKRFNLHRENYRKFKIDPEEFMAMDPAGVNSKGWGEI